MYATTSGIEISKGIPHLSYIMMGLQDTEEGPGWFNGTNYAELQNHNYEYEPTKESAQEYIQGRLHKAYAVDFFRRKV